MVKMSEIFCKHCGQAISLNDEWDRTPNDFAPGDWHTRSCVMCGGELTVYGRWIDPPAAHRECTDLGWQAEPCTMCFGPIAASGDDVTFHSNCKPEYWYERACAICEHPLQIHVDWENPPTMHRNCAEFDWYEKDCKYCATTLKVHVGWKNPPVAHPECVPQAEDVPQATTPHLLADVIDEPAAQTADIEEILYTSEYDLTPSISFNGNGHSAEDIPEVETAFDYNADEDAPAFKLYRLNLLPKESPAEESAEMCMETQNGYSLDEDLSKSLEDTSTGTVYDAPAALVEEETEVSIPDAYELRDEETIEPVMDAPEEVLGADIIERSPYVVNNEVVDEELTEPAVVAAAFEMFDEEIVEPEDETLMLHDTPEQAEEVVVSEPAVEEERDLTRKNGEYACSRCGKRLIHVEEFYTGYRSASFKSNGLCKKCEYDALLVSGAMAALKKGYDFKLNFAVETRERAVSENITVVTNAETNEVVAEIMLCDDGIFSVERAAVSYDPSTGQRFSKTVVGKKGFFSSLRTADTYDRDGKLVEHTRPTEELALAACDDNEDQVVQVAKNRFFLRRGK